jgi:hypothetical protein
MCHASMANQSSPTRPAAATAVIRKSKGELSSGCSSDEAYAAPEKIAASDQSAGEASQRSNRAAAMATAISAHAVAYPTGRGL